MVPRPKTELLLNILWWAVCGLLAVAAVVFLLPRLAPFLLGLGLAVVIHPIVGWVSRQSGCSARVSSLFVTLLVLALAVALLWGAGMVLWVQFQRLAEQFPTLWQQEVLPFVRRLGDFSLSLARRFFPNSGHHLGQFSGWVESSLKEWGTTLSSNLMSAFADRLKKLPLFLLTVLFTLMATLMISWDYAKITTFLARQLPPSGVRLLHRVKAILAGSVLRLGRAYGLLFFLTLAELSLGLWLLGIKEFFVVALIIALLDLLPVVGSGLVLGSWSAVVLGSGRIPLGIGLLVLWAVVSLVRAFLEPKIVGGQIGLHPLVTLTAMYFGLRTAGVMGLLAVPLLCMVAVRLQDDGSLKFYK